MEVKLKVLTGKNTGKSISVPVKRFLIGRADDCHLRPKSDAISRNHCVILVSDDEAVVRDLNSRNGTLLNGEAVEGDHVLATGDVLKVGKIEFELAVKAKKKKKKKKEKKPQPVEVKADDGSMEFDVSEWLDEADVAARSARASDPETRQYKLDETDRIALDKSAENSEEDSSDKPVLKRPEKREPGKLPVAAPIDSDVSSQDAAADMLKKFFNSR
ncbi:MAG: FHA domain-containing protein [Pirellulaceae bacterium]|jgi:pSer/pThr/pTyr-binding forkhead associated (FHA) protein|nr:FHA domain-containing protein [Pirellulaceae bacterium]